MSYKSVSRISYQEHMASELKRNSGRIREKFVNPIRDKRMRKIYKDFPSTYLAICFSFIFASVYLWEDLFIAVIN